MVGVFSGKTLLVTGGTGSFSQLVVDESETDTATSVTPSVKSSSLPLARQYPDAEDRRNIAAPEKARYSTSCRHYREQVSR